MLSPFSKYKVRCVMKIDKKAIEYRKKKGADFFIIQGEKSENFSGCSAGSGGGVLTIRPEVELGYGELPESLEVLDVDGEKVVVFFEVESCITPETEIKLDSMFFIKTLILENAVPVVLQND